MYLCLWVRRRRGDEWEFKERQSQRSVDGGWSLSDLPCSLFFCLLSNCDQMLPPHDLLCENMSVCDVFCASHPTVNTAGQGPACTHSLLCQACSRLGGPRFPPRAPFGFPLVVDYRAVSVVTSNKRSRLGQPINGHPSAPEFSYSRLLAIHSNYCPRTGRKETAKMGLGRRAI